MEIISKIFAVLIYHTPQVTPQVAALIKALTGEMDRAALQAALGLADRKSFVQRYLQPALNAGFIELTRPESPNSRLQAYRLTAAGRVIKKKRR